MNISAPATTPDNTACAHELTPHATLDLRGVRCPLPPLRTARALARLEPGQVLEVLGTSPIGNHTAPWLAQLLGSQLVRDVPDDGFRRLYYRKP